MNCLNCQKELTNPKAKYCSDKCRKVYSRSQNNPDKNPDTDTLKPGQTPPGQEPGQPEQEVSIPGQNFVPNWKRNGFGSKEEGMLHAIAQAVKNQSGETFTWQNQTWTINSFSKKFLTEVKPLISS